MRLLVIICTFVLGFFIHRSQAQVTIDIGNLTEEQLAAVLASLGEQGVSVEDQNECEQIESPCPENSICGNTFGGFNCTCKSAFTSTGTGDNGDTGCEDIDECADETTCAGITGSECQNNPGGYECCSDGFMLNTDGNACVDFNECDVDPDPCTSLVGSTCMNNDGSFTCDCALGYQPNLEMTTCEDIDECDGDTCMGIDGSDCQNTEGSYQCNCDTGYEVNTEMTACVDINECDEDACVEIEGSDCKNTEGSFQCCETGYEVNTEMTACVDIDECDPLDIMHDCETNQVCKNNDGAFTCECADGYEPDTDTTDTDTTGCKDIDECESTTSCDTATDALCQNTVGGFNCFCLTGLYGSGLPGQCSDALSCSTFDTLKNSITAIQSADAGADVSADKEILDNYFSASGKADGVPGDSYRAVYNGDLDQSIDNIIDNLRCDFFSSCTEDDSSGGTVYTCTCDEGYQHVNGVTQCEDIDECTGSPCGDMATCVNNLASYTCTCPDGYELDGGVISADCVDINECERETDDCDENANCENKEGTFDCTCKDGYMGSGQSCESATSCEAFNKVKNAIDTICFTEEDGANAATILEYYIAATGKPDAVPGDTFRARFGTDLPDAVTAAIELLRCDYFSNCSETVVEDVTEFQCSCFDGYAPTAENINQCSDEDECALEGADACEDTGTCKNMEGTYMCSCNDGYEGGDGAPCSDIDECERGTDDCDENANCMDQDGTFDCTCKDGYMGSGQTCESATSCEAFNKVKSAIHTLSFTEEDGADAETILGYYIAATGRPTAVPGDSFRAKFVSELPDIATTAIDLLRCDYFSECSETVGSDSTEYQCSCLDGYAATATNENQCSDKDECTLEGIDPCEDTGTCENLEGTYMCSCNGGYEGGDGAPCSDIDECTTETHECGVTGECLNKAGGYSCNPCATGYEGGENGPCTDINECTKGTASCDSNAGCENFVGSFECACNPQYMGTGNTCRSVLTCEAFNDLKEAIATIQNENATDDEVSMARTLLQQYRDANGRPEGIIQNAFRARFTESLDIDIENTVDLLRCDFFSECSYDGTAYDCTCMSGYESDEENGGCQDIDECDAENPTHDCHEHATCTNAQGSFVCKCNDGFFGTDGTSCSDHDECKDEGDGNECHENATCDNFDGGHSCTCIEGFYGDGENCQEVNTCDAFNAVKASISAIQDGSTEEEEAAARKTLQEYHQATGKTGTISGDSYRFAYSDPIDVISNVLDHLICDYHSTCSSEDSGTNTCTCDTNHIPGDTANTCLNVQSCATFNKVKTAIAAVQENSDDAAAREILNAFTLADGHAPAVEGTSYRARYESTTDEDLLAALDKLPCDFFSTCSDRLECVCIEGYQDDGDTKACTDVDECSTEVDNNCHANAMCSNTEGAFECRCNSGFTGDGVVCEDEDQCGTPDSTLCGANAQCTDTVGSFECSCTDGYTGNGEVCIQESVCLFSTDSDLGVENCDEFDHPLSCSFKRDFPQIAKETFDAFSSSFNPPNELVGAVAGTRDATEFAATLGSIVTGTQSLCRQSSSYASLMKASTDPEGTMEVEIFSYDCQRQWFTTTECEGIVEGINAQCYTLRAPAAALVITRDDTTGKYEVMQKRVYLPSSCQFRFNSA